MDELAREYGRTERCDPRRGGDRGGTFSIGISGRQLNHFVVNACTLPERYKDHLIVPLAIPAREDTGQYLSVASISWNEDGTRTSHLLYNSGDRYKDRNLAIFSAIPSAKKWIDDKEEERL